MDKLSAPSVRLVASRAVVRPEGAGPEWFDPQAYLGPRGFRYFSEGTRRWLAACVGLEDFAGSPSGAQELGMCVGSHGGGDHTLRGLDSVLLSEGADALSPMLAPGFCNNIVAGQAAIRLAARRFNSTLCTPGVAGLDAVLLALRELRAGRCTTVIAGAFEEPDIHPGRLDGALAVALRCASDATGPAVKGGAQAFLPPGASADAARRAAAVIVRQGMPPGGDAAVTLVLGGASPVLAAGAELLVSALGLRLDRQPEALSDAHGAIEPLQALVHWLQSGSSGIWIFFSAQGHVRLVMA